MLIDVWGDRIGDGVVNGPVPGNQSKPRKYHPTKDIDSTAGQEIMILTQHFNI